jgi:Protein of unknown function (DUF3309)
MPASPAMPRRRRCPKPRRHRRSEAGTTHNLAKGNVMSLGTILLIVLILLLIGVIPSWPHSRSWGYGPSGGLALVVVIVLVLLLMGRI